MTGRDEIWDVMKSYSKDKFDEDRARFMGEAHDADDGGWTKHTEFHWSRIAADGKRLDYWPSRKKWQHNGRVKRGPISALRRLFAIEAAK